MSGRGKTEIRKRRSLRRARHPDMRRANPWRKSPWMTKAQQDQIVELNQKHRERQGE